MTSILNTFYQCCETKTENNQEILSNNESIIKSISNQDKKIYLYNKCNSNSNNSNNEKSNEKRYSFISNISQNSVKKSYNFSIGKNNDNSLIFNINSSMKEYNKLLNNNHQYTTSLTFNHIKENNCLKERISLTQINEESNKKNPFFLDSKLFSINNSIYNSSIISSFSKLEKPKNIELKGIIIDNNNNNINFFKKKSKVNLNDESIIMDEEINLAPKLIITDKKKDNLFNGKVIKIDASGYYYSLRGKRDGKTYFGIYNNSFNKNNNNNDNNDIIINLKYNINIKQLFLIFYDKKKTRYYIQYLNKEFNKNKLFMSIRIFNEFFINKNENQFLYLLLGKLLIHVTIYENDILNFKIFKNFSSSNEKRKMSQYNFEIKDSPITIGRENCSITIDNNYLSRIHATFIYGNNNKWCLIDGNEKRKHSTHGTWIILNNNIFELNPTNENYEVKIGEQTFNISIQTE